ncbi:hypothetical protein M422DRAFT_25546 [Sphaerobolus stellatus SS14]|nr:hypothetical protein M422DRAFT_25546 [Sphaerobolus stellatus SS14]
MSPSLSITYVLQPPSSTTPPHGLSSTTTREFPVKPSTNLEAFKAYYAALRDTVEEAKETLGKELTAWRDAVGDAEKDKVGGKVREDLDDAVEEEEDDVAQ